MINALDAASCLKPLLRHSSLDLAEEAAETLRLLGFIVPDLYWTPLKKRKSTAGPSFQQRQQPGPHP